LIQLEKNVPVDFILKNYFWQEFDQEKAIEILKKYEFNSLIEKIAGIMSKAETKTEIKTKTLF